MNFAQIYPLVMLFIFGQIAGIVSGVYFNIQSWKWRSSDNSVTYSWLVFMFVIFIMISVVLVVFVGGSNVKGFLRFIGTVFLAHTFVLWPACNQVRQYKMSLFEAYFGTVFQYHVTIFFGFCCFLIYVNQHNILRSDENIGIELVAFLLHIMVVFYLMAFARPFWTRELNKLRKLVMRRISSHH